jgi:hypothetical protein
MPLAKGDAGDQYFVLKSHDGIPVANRRYRALSGSKVIEGFTNSEGRSTTLDGYVGQLARFDLIDDSHDEHFVLKDPLGNPFADMRYKIKSADGVEFEGVTDHNGRTGLFTSDKIENIELFYIDSDFAEDEGVN